MCQETTYSIRGWFHWTMNWYSILETLFLCKNHHMWKRAWQKKTLKTWNFVSVPHWNGHKRSLENGISSKNYFFQYNTWGFKFISFSLSFSLEVTREPWIAENIHLKKYLKPICLSGNILASIKLHLVTVVPDRFNIVRIIIIQKSCLDLLG